MSRWLLLFTSLVACRPGQVADVARPKNQTAEEGLAQTGGIAAMRCDARGPKAEPLVVDLPPETRGELEQAMQRGVAVVRYDCAKLEVLRDCAIDGRYGFLGMTLKEQLVRLEGETELAANLSLGSKIAAKLSGELTRGAVLDVALALVGRRMSTWRTAQATDLRGRCEGATHFVRGATVGAFVVESMAKAVVRSVAEVFGQGASAKDSSKQMYRQMDGVIDDCRRARATDATPPAQCGALVRLELAAVAAPQGSGAEAAGLAGACPSGFVRSGDGTKCTTPAASGAHVCDPSATTARDDCQTQCGRGSADSCFYLASFYDHGTGVPRDDARAATLYKQACDGQSAAACRGLGFLHATGRGVPLDHARAAALFQAACQLGDAPACGNLGVCSEAGWGVPADPSRALALYRQSCDGGDPAGCNALGHLFDAGAVVPRDDLRAASLYKQACDGGDANGCHNLGWLYASGRGVPRDEPRGVALFERACKGGDANGCSAEGWMRALGRGIARDVARGKALLDQGCKGGHAWGCERAKALDAPAPSVVAPPPPQKKPFRFWPWK